MVIHKLSTGRLAPAHSQAFRAACQAETAGAVSRSWKAARSEPAGKPKGNRRRGSQIRNPPGKLGRWTDFLAKAEAVTGRLGAEVGGGDTFDAGPTRTWVRGRGSGQLGRRPLSRFGPAQLH